MEIGKKEVLVSEMGVSHSILDMVNLWDVQDAYMNMGIWSSGVKSELEIKFRESLPPTGGS